MSLEEQSRKRQRLREQKARYMRRVRGYEEAGPHAETEQLVNYWTDLLGEELRDRLIREAHAEIGR